MIHIMQKESLPAARYTARSLSYICFSDIPFYHIHKALPHPQQKFADAAFCAPHLVQNLLL